MERPRLAKLSALGSAQGAALYFVELSIIVASYIGFAEAALFLPASNPSGTPVWPATGLALALVLLRGYRIWPAILVGSLSPYFLADRSLLELGAVGSVSRRCVCRDVADWSVVGWSPNL